MLSRALFSIATIVLCHVVIRTSAELASTGQNLIVYFSQSSGRNANLTDLCMTAAVDVVIIGFVRSFNGTGGYPTVDFGPSICNETRPANATVAPGLAICAKLGQQVKQCQEMGKKIFVSIGGSTSNTTFEAGDVGREEAKRAANLMWNLFGDGKGLPSLRPFGRDVVVDGFDLDHEQGSYENHNVFISMLRSYRDNASKSIYLSAAPVCTLKNATISRDTLALVDFIFIRFYNSAACALGTPGFSPSLKKWYQDIVPAPYSPFPKVFLGGLSFDNGNTGYVSAEDFRNALQVARQPNMSCWWNEKKFGGAALWDGPRGLANQVDGVDFLTSVKDALTDQF